MSESSGIQKLGMPKWGLSMTEGRLVDWLVEDGTELTVGGEVAEVETEKINGVVEAPAAGTLRRRVASVGDVIPVGGLLGVIADASVPDADIDAFIAEFEASFVPGEAFLTNPRGGPNLLFQVVPEPKRVKNRVHLDLGPTERTRDQEVARLEAAGATVVGDHRNPDGTGWVVMADPEGNEFCVERSDAERSGIA